MRFTISKHTSKGNQIILIVINAKERSAPTWYNFRQQIRDLMVQEAGLVSHDDTEEWYVTSESGPRRFWGKISHIPASSLIHHFKPGNEIKVLGLAAEIFCRVEFSER